MIFADVSTLFYAHCLGIAGLHVYSHIFYSLQVYSHIFFIRFLTVGVMVIHLYRSSLSIAECNAIIQKADVGGVGGGQGVV